MFAEERSPAPSRRFIRYMARESAILAMVETSAALVTFGYIVCLRMFSWVAVIVGLVSLGYSIVLYFASCALLMCAPSMCDKPLSRDETMWLWASSLYTVLLAVVVVFATQAGAKLILAN